MVLPRIGALLCTIYWHTNRRTLNKPLKSGNGKREQKEQGIVNVKREIVTVRVVSLYCHPVEELLRAQDRQTVESGTLHHRLMCFSCEYQHRRIGLVGLLPLRVQFVRSPQLRVEMLDLRRGKHVRE